MKGAKKSLNKKINYLVYFLIVNFILILLELYTGLVKNIFIGTELFLLPLASFSFFGFLLVYLLRKTKIQGNLRRNLNLVGYSAGLLFVSAVLHNIASAIGMIFTNKEFEEPFFFILAVFVLPALFIIGIVRSIMIVRQK